MLYVIYFIFSVICYMYYNKIKIVNAPKLVQHKTTQK